MLFELLTSLMTRCPPYVRHMNYLDELIAMKSRFERNRASWQPHLENSRRFVLSAAETCRNRSKAVILGSGLLLDVPLEELSSLFREVVLIDVVILPAVGRRVKSLGNVRIVQRDVTNMAEELYENIRRDIGNLPDASPAIPEIDENTGYVVSLNILSQLWVMPRAYALKNLTNLTEERIDDWCGRIVEAHYDFLRALPCATCLVADHAFVKRDGSGSIVSRGSTVAGHALPAPDASWIWHILPLGRERRFLSKELVVGAWNMIRNDEDRRAR